MLKSFVLPKVQTCIGILGSTYTAFTGVSADMTHSVMLFHNPYDSISDYTSSLDLASMQFGDAGHSPGGKGKMPFALDSIAELEVRHARLATDSEILAVFVRMHDEDGADGVDYEKQEWAFGALPDSATLMSIAQRVKEAGEQRQGELVWILRSVCAGIKVWRLSEKVWFCGKEHQRMAWSFHKGYCQRG